MQFALKRVNNSVNCISPMRSLIPWNCNCNTNNSINNFIYLFNFIFHWNWKTFYCIKLTQSLTWSNRHTQSICRQQHQHQLFYSILFCSVLLCSVVSSHLLLEAFFIDSNTDFIQLIQLFSSILCSFITRILKKLILCFVLSCKKCQNFNNIMALW